MKAKMALTIRIIFVFFFFVDIRNVLQYHLRHKTIKNDFVFCLAQSIKAIFYSILLCMYTHTSSLFVNCNLYVHVDRMLFTKVDNYSTFKC